MPRVLRVITRMNVGGPSIQVAELCTRLQDEYSTFLVAGRVPNNENSMEGLLGDNGPNHMNSLRREISPWQDWKSIRTLGKIINAFDPHIIHTHQAKAWFVANQAASVLDNGPKLVHTFHGHTFHGYFKGFKGLLIKSMQAKLAENTDVLIAISDSQKEDIVKNLKCNHNKVRVIPLGFDLSNFKFRKKGRSERFNVGIAGRLAPIKNHKMFLKAASHIVHTLKNENMRFFIVGDGELREELIKERNLLHLNYYVDFLGNIPHDRMPDFYQAMDAVVCTSLNEGTPVSLIEAMASGTPVVATNVGGIKDMLFVKKVKDMSWSDMGDILNRLHLEGSSDDLKDASDMVHVYYDIDFLIQEIRDLYKELLCG